MVLRGFAEKIGIVCPARVVSVVIDKEDCVSVVINFAIIIQS